MAIRALVLSDSHLGFDLPARPRIRRRRRCHDFLANYRSALRPAVSGEVDLVVHAGDVFHLPRVSRELVYEAFEPLKRIAGAGIPVFVVPGNHERSKIPHAHLAGHPGVHLFDAPRTFQLTVRGTRLAVSGFPYQRRDVRSRFPTLFEATELGSLDYDVAILCMHHCVEGATVGPADYTFRDAPDVVACADVPPGLAAVVSGHVHRHQVLTTDMSGRPLAAPVLYPGSIERTAFAELGEPKGYILLELAADAGRSGGRVLSWRFESLSTRPMIERALRVDGLGALALERMIRDAVSEAPVDSVLRLRLHGRIDADARPALSATRLRALAPPDMNLDVILVDEPRPRRRLSRRTARRAPRTLDDPQGELALGPPKPRDRYPRA
ncbi:MAG: DNA repair exonuclease [Gemmatimonadota bacterium]|nr:DNA repair exonuclease [Gemmatimonadota bacterium]